MYLCNRSITYLKVCNLIFFSDLILVGTLNPQWNPNDSCFLLYVLLDKFPPIFVVDYFSDIEEDEMPVLHISCWDKNRTSKDGFMYVLFDFTS